jgi:hypothetical protein
LPLSQDEERKALTSPIHASTVEAICDFLTFQRRSWPCYTPLPAQTAAAAVIVVASTTVTRPLQQRLLCNCHLRPRHTAESWRGPHLLPLTGRLIGRWNPQTLTTLRGVAGWCRVPSTTGFALTGLHQPKGLHHRAFRRMREDRKTKMTVARSRWSSVPLGHG